MSLRIGWDIRFIHGIHLRAEREAGCPRARKADSSRLLGVNEGANGLIVIASPRGGALRKQSMRGFVRCRTN